MKTLKKVWINWKKVYNKTKQIVFKDVYDDIVPSLSFDIEVVDGVTQISKTISSDDILTMLVTSADGTDHRVIISPSLLADHTEGIIMNQRSNQLTIKNVDQDLQNFKAFVTSEFINVNNKIDQVEARLDNKIDTKIAEVKAEINTKITEVKTEIKEMKKEFDTKIDTKTAEVKTEINTKIDTKIAEVNTKMDKGFEEIKELIKSTSKPK